MTPDQRETVTDEMMERAWAAIVGADIAGSCHSAHVVRGDIHAALTAALRPSPSSAPEGGTLELYECVRQESEDSPAYYWPIPEAVAVIEAARALDRAYHDNEIIRQNATRIPVWKALADALSALDNRSENGL